MSGSSAHEALVSVRGLGKRWPGGVEAVRDVSFDIEAGETLGLVGESGCGKTSIALSLLRLTEPTAGRVLFDGRDVTAMDRVALRAFRRRAQIVFQDPGASLNPRLTVGAALHEVLRVHRLPRGPASRRARVEELLEQVGLGPETVARFPNELSGGQRQRVGIARALAVEPDFLVLDEPVSALDVSVQAQVLNLLSSLQERLELTCLFVTHDLALVEHLCDRVAVMYRGRIVESGPVDRIFGAPTDPYTRGLLESAMRSPEEDAPPGDPRPRP